MTKTSHDYHTSPLESHVGSPLKENIEEVNLERQNELGKSEVRRAKLKICRYSPERGEGRHFDQFEIEVDATTTLIDAFEIIKDTIDPTFTFRSSCHDGVCGSCTVIVNGVERQACFVTVFELLKGQEELVIEPMRNFKIIRDLVVDMTPFFDKLKAVKPRIVLEDTPVATEEELPQSRENLDKMKNSERCIECGACVSACPIVSINPHFLGPAALVAAYRSSIDSRDQRRHERLEIVDSENGAWRCHSIYHCFDVCPKNVEPAVVISMLRRMIVSERIKRPHF
jgi:fumarate reductase iron-sulfur subunit